MSARNFVLTLSCQDRPRIVATVTTALAELGGNIAESAQFWDKSTNNFFMRIAFQIAPEVGSAMIRTALAPAIATFGMNLSLLDGDRVPRIIILVSKFDH